MKRVRAVALASAAAAVVLASCSRGTGTSDLYLLEALEAARSIEDPGERIRRLEIFAANNPRHPYRIFAWEEIFETMAVKTGDGEEAVAYLAGLLDGQRDPAVRGRLLFAEFEHFWQSDSLRAVELAGEIIAGGESDFRLLMYMAYYLMEAGGHEDLAAAVFERLIDVTDEGIRKDHVRTVYGEFLEKIGRREEAASLFMLASSYPFANEELGRILWEEGMKEEALEAYIRLAAGAPGYREYVRLDSLYSTVYPSSNDLETRIAAERITSGRALPRMAFVDTRGMRHSIGGRRGAKLVITAFSPT